MEKRRKEETHMQARSGVARRRVQAHDMRVNGPPKFGLGPWLHFVVYFYYESVSNTFFIEIESVTRHRNPSRFSSINMCGRHGTCNYELRTQSKSHQHI
jgi:hypothetical protein